MLMRQLNVYMNKLKAGVLTEQRPGEGYSFRYDDAYLASGSPSISVTLSKKQGSYESPTLFPFFMNMLPEGANRKVICRTSRVDESDFFGLLSAMAGKDFIGGVHIEAVSK